MEIGTSDLRVKGCMDVTSEDTVFIRGWEREICQALKQAIALDVTAGHGEALVEEET